MQVNSQKRENTQTTILALLLTHKGGCTLRQLNNDYYETEGEYIPWKELGYSSLLAFLYSMSKTVQIENKNNTFIIQGIASEKSKHVSKLVAGQKCQKPFFGRKFYKPNHYFPTTAPPRIRIPAEILSRIISLVNDHPDGVNKYYVLQEIHLCMPFANITMKDMEEQLQELSHTIFQTSTKIYPIHAKVKGFNNLKNYNNMTSNSKSQNGEKYKSLSVTVAGDEDSNDILNYDEEDILEFSHSDSFYSKSIKSKSTSSFIKETVFKYQDQETECLQNETPKTQHNNDTQIQMKLNNSIEKDEENVLDKKNVEILINERIKFRLEKLIQNHHDGIWCADLPKKYLEEYKVSLNYEELGFNSVREFASQLPDIFHCIQPHNAGDFMLYYAKREIPSNKIKENDKINNITDWYNIYETIDEEALPAEVSPDTCKILIPDNVMSIGEYVGYINVADLAQNEEPFIEVFVVEVFTPSFFWIQLRKKQKIFIKFMDDLHKFYTINHEQYVIPLVVLERGLNCACIYNGLWHRGIIKSVKPDLQVTVMFYDYGTLKTYSPGTVYYLHRMFSNLPAQAIPCGLINTRPYKGSKWSRGATYYFAVRTSKIPLVATIASVNIEDNSMIISLTDTLEEEDVHINDWLVEQNLAEHGKMVDKVDMSNLLLYVEENLILSPEQFYEEEETNTSNDNENLSDNAINMPLISPQSTLNDELFKPSSDCISLDEQKKLQIEEDIQDHTFQNNSTSNISTFNKNNTNPFIQDESLYDQLNDDISPQKFMQLWQENMQIQMQISATLNILLNKVIDSTKNVNDNLTSDESTLNIIKNAFLHANKRMPIFTDSSSTNITNTQKNIFFSNENINKEKNTAINQQSSYTDYFQNSNIQNFLMSTNNVFDTINQSLSNQEISDIPLGFEKYNCKSFGNNIDSDQISMEDSINDKTSLKETNPFRLSLAGKLQILDTQEENSSCSNEDELLHVLHKNCDAIVKEHDLINCENDNSKINYTNQLNHNDSFALNEKSFNLNVDEVINTTSKITIDDEITQHSICNKEMEKSFILNTKSFNWNIDEVINTTSKITTDNQITQHSICNKEMEKSFTLNAKSLNVDEVINTTSKITTDDQAIQHNIRNKEMEKHCFSPSKKTLIDSNLQYVENAYKHEPITIDTSNFNQSLWKKHTEFVVSGEIPNCKTINENITFFPNYDSSNYISSTLLHEHSSEYSTLANTNINGKHLTHTSTSHTLYSSSPIIELNEVQYNKKSIANSNKVNNISTKILCKPLKDTTQLKNCNKMYYSENNDEKGICNKIQQENNYENILNFEVNANAMEMKNSYSKKTELNTIENATCIPEYLSLNHKILFQIVDSAYISLSRRRIFISR
ncbi:tudor domain-containing protein 5-like isoform X3 [Apis laboriosa]|uniref:tudor domain-containing protein 5-like isoform X3 n=1 Tax=Apis laboriosa TaxID=183418 RepID=UPI001CC7758B|nr:tudor domain-containing protein 5-like isoform X3 [Apis laboriosa]